MRRTLGMVLAISGFLPAETALGQGGGRSARELVGVLAHPTLEDQMGLDPCSIDRRYRPVVRALVEMGPPALGEIELALDSMERRGADSEFFTNASWVVLAYAEMRRQDAYPRLRRMAADPRLAHIHPSLAWAAAISLGLTDSVSTAGPAGRVFACDGMTAPRDALSQFVSA
ncbi:MAG: hypothetical protein HY821_04110 [Acidobacteria bacterium]|nr:hypothetical protein [Acidobacteriota bacterium]